MSLFINIYNSICTIGKFGGPLTSCRINKTLGQTWCCMTIETYKPLKFTSCLFIEQNLVAIDSYSAFHKTTKFTCPLRVVVNAEQTGFKGTGFNSYQLNQQSHKTLKVWGFNTRDRSFLNLIQWRTKKWSILVSMICFWMKYGLKYIRFSHAMIVVLK